MLRFDKEHSLLMKEPFLILKKGPFMPRPTGPLLTRELMNRIILIDLAFHIIPS